MWPDLRKPNIMAHTEIFSTYKAIIKLNAKTHFIKSPKTGKKAKMSVIFNNSQTNTRNIQKH